MKKLKYKFMIVINLIHLVTMEDTPSIIVTILMKVYNRSDIGLHLHWMKEIV